MSEKITNGGFDEFENALKLLRPETQLQRDQVIYRAGQASRGGWLWPVCTFAMTTVAGVLGVMLALRPQPEIVERVVYVTVKPEPKIAVALAVAPVPEQRMPETPRSEPTPFVTSNRVYLTVGAVFEKDFDPFKWRHETRSDASPSSSPDPVSLEPPTLFNLMNAWTKEKSLLR